ncbi:ASTRA-associated protein 1, partial [Lecanoromycetidae sp. Uapishka_2]
MPQLPSTQKVLKEMNVPDPLLIAVPNTIDSGGIDIYQLPSQARAAQIYADRSITTGMVMALSILADSTRIQVAAGYESGHTMVFVQNDPAASFQKLYSAQPHKQPILSVAISPSKEHYLTTSADAIVSKHPLPAAKSIWNTDLKPIKVSQTKHSGQQGLQYRSDGKVFATAGWDAHIRVYSGKTMKELAVLRWHKVGCYATAFATVKPLANCTAKTIPAPEERNEESTLVTQPKHTVLSVQQRRDDKARSTHWLAAGAKDGKVSLWDIY